AWRGCGGILVNGVTSVPYAQRYTGTVMASEYIRDWTPQPCFAYRPWTATPKKVLGPSTLAQMSGVRCEASALEPDKLHAPGLMRRPGDAKHTVFRTARLYQVTCITIHIGS